MYDEILRNAVNTGEWGKRVNKMMRAQETKNKTLLAACTVQISCLKYNLNLS